MKQRLQSGTPSKAIWWLLWFVLLVLVGYERASAQTEDGINWISFSQLEVALSEQPRPVLLSFYTDWCAYCKKMDRTAFRNPEVIETINANFYAVRMDAESPDTVRFGGRDYENREWGRQRRPVHEIPRLLASRRDRPFSVPAHVLIDKEFSIQSRSFEYMDSDGLLDFLSSVDTRSIQFSVR